MELKLPHLWVSWGSHAIERDKQNFKVSNVTALYCNLHLLGMVSGIGHRTSGVK